MSGSKRVFEQTIVHIEDGGIARPGRCGSLGPGRLMNAADRETFACGHAWEARDHRAATGHFSENATYRETPFEEPALHSYASVAEQVPDTEIPIFVGTKFVRFRAPVRLNT